MTSLVCVPVWVLIALKADGFVSLSKFLSCFHSEACSRWYFRNAVCYIIVAINRYSPSATV